MNIGKMTGRAELVWKTLEQAHAVVNNQIHLFASSYAAQR